MNKFHLVLIFWGSDKAVHCCVGYAYCDTIEEAENQMREQARRAGTVPVRWAWVLADEGIDSFMADLQKRIDMFRKEHAIRIGIN